MHVAITHARLMFLILAAVAVSFLILGIAPIEPATMPLPVCPPQC
jgi:small neutral amino acid transporter SnatA (MarC family)